MAGYDISTIAILIIFGLIVLIVFSFTFIVRSLYSNYSAKSKKTDEIEKKLDKIIALLEKDRNS